MRPDTAAGFVRAAIEAYLAGAAFAWFVDRDRPRRPVRRPGRRPDWGGREDKAAPVALLPAALADRIGASTPVVQLTDRTAARQFWRYGRASRRPTVPAARYGEIQAIVDGAEPRPRRDGRDWVFERGGMLLALRLSGGGVAEVLAYRPR